MKKLYVILYRKRYNSITIPIKAVKNEYDNTDQFAGGTPAIFGGTEKTGGLDTTLKREVKEESRDTLKVFRGFNLFLEKRDIQGTEYKFYWTTKWSYTKNEWQNPNDRDEGEMNRVVRVYIDKFSIDDTPNDVIDKLLEFTGTSGASQKKLKEFRNSLTADAFIQFIYNNVSLGRLR